MCIKMIDTHSYLSYIYNKNHQHNSVFKVMYHRHPLFALLISVVSKVKITGFIHTTLTRVILTGDVHVYGQCLPFITSRLLVYSVIVIRVSHVFT